MKRNVGGQEKKTGKKEKKVAKESEYGARKESISGYCWV